MKKDKHGGSCIFVSNVINVREEISLKNLRRDKNLKYQLLNQLILNYSNLCIYRSPHSDVKIFLGILDELLSKVMKRGLFGDT
jgi:hypothetical protein